MYWWRITKYNPENRNENGAYLKDEWISYGDIGNYFSGKRLMLEEYLRVEQSYFNAILLFMDFLNVHTLNLCNLERYPFWEDMQKLTAPMQRVYEKDEGSILTVSNIIPYTNLILRSFIWAKLKNLPYLEVHFGYDYYMYIGSITPCYEVHQAILDLGLFIESWRSPYTF